MTFIEPNNTFVADTMTSFLDQMDITAKELLQAIDNDLDENVLITCNDKVEPHNTVDSIDELPDETVFEGLEDCLCGHTYHVFRDYLEQLEESYTIVETPSGWHKVIQLSRH